MSDTPAPTSGAEPLLRVRGLGKSFPILGGLMRREVARVEAVSDLTFDLARG